MKRLIQKQQKKTFFITRLVVSTKTNYLAFLAGEGTATTKEN